LSLALAGATPEKGKATLPESASECARDLAPAAAKLKKLIAAAPYGRRWKDLAHTAPPPKEKNELGEAETHPDLKRDPIEMQEQARYIEETGVEGCFGLVSMRGVHVFAYGRLRGVEIVIDRIGRDPAQSEAFEADLRAVRDAWKDPIAALALGEKFKVASDDLAKPDAPERKLPLRVQFVPISERSKR
jgi:hypothetical protein